MSQESRTAESQDSNSPMFTDVPPIGGTVLSGLQHAIQKLEAVIQAKKELVASSATPAATLEAADERLCLASRSTFTRLLDTADYGRKVSTDLVEQARELIEQAAEMIEPTAYSGAEHYYKSIAQKLVFLQTIPPSGCVAALFEKLISDVSA